MHYVHVAQRASVALWTRLLGSRSIAMRYTADIVEDERHP